MCVRAGVAQLVEPVLASDGNSFQQRKTFTRYFDAGIEESRSSPELSLSGPDGTKLGVDLQLTFAAVMYQATRKVASCPPQAKT